MDKTSWTYNKNINLQQILNSDSIKGIKGIIVHGNLLKCQSNSRKLELTSESRCESNRTYVLHVYRVLDIGFIDKSFLDTVHRYLWRCPSNI